MKKGKKNLLIIYRPYIMFLGGFLYMNNILTKYLYVVEEQSIKYEHSMKNI